MVTPGPARFEFATSTRILFGAGVISELASMAEAWGPRLTLVTGSQPSRWDAVLDSHLRRGAQVDVISLIGEPTTDFITGAIAETRARGCDAVIGLGGGSVIDAAKAIAGLVPQPGDVFDHLEVVGRAQPLSEAPLPWLAVPTTAGAGAEVTRNAVLTSPQHRVKASLRSPALLARVALVDPELTFDLPPALTAATGLDALTQVIEPFLCTRANPVTDALCREAIPRIARALPRAVEDGHDRAARTDMALGALHGGLALANAGLGSVHGLAAPLGGQLAAPHGAICAALLPHALELNLRLLPPNPAGHATRHRMIEVARLLTGRPAASAEDGIGWLHELVARLGIPSLRTYGLEPAQFEGLAVAALGASSMKANPVQLSKDQVIGLLRAAW